MAKQTFTTGQVLTAAQMTSLQETAMTGGPASTKTVSYVLVAADAGTRVAMNAAGSTTITVNTGLFSAGDTVSIQNIGAGVCTVTAGTATVNTSGSLVLAQYQGGILYFTSASAAIFFQFATPASGDIEGVTAGTGISGGGTSGTVTITNSMATEITAKADLIVGTGNAAFDNLAVGANGTVLTADSTVSPTGLKWAAPSSGALVFITGTTFSAVSSFSLPDPTFSSTYDNYLVRLQLTDASAASAVTLKLRAGGSDTSTGYYSAQYRVDYLLNVTSLGENATTSWGLGSINTGGTNQQIFQYDLNLKQVFNTKHTMVNAAGSINNIVSSVGLLAKVDLTSYDSLTFACSTGTITGNYRVYGYVNS